MTDGLAAGLAAEGLAPSSWGNGPGDTYAPHSHGYDKVLVATRGSITFHLIDAGRHDARRVGGTKRGECLEAHLPAGSLPAEPRHLEKSW